MKVSRTRARHSVDVGCDGNGKGNHDSRLKQRFAGAANLGGKEFEHFD
jgi:hypothetical protein